MLIAATAATSSGTRTTLSLSEYSVCTRRWTKACDIGLSGIPGAPHDGLERARQRQVREPRTTIPVDLHVRRAHREREQRAAHREQRLLENVEAIDLVAIRPADAEGERARADEEREPLALLRR